MTDDNEFAAFVRAHTTVLARGAYLLTGNVAEADELVQDTMVRLYTRWNRVIAADSPLAYARRSVANNFIDQQRRRRHHDTSSPIGSEAVSERDVAVGVADRDEVWRLLGTVTARQRVALVLRYFHDQSDADIAAALGCRVGTVRSLISRGLQDMRAHQTSSGSESIRRPQP